MTIVACLLLVGAAGVLLVAVRRRHISREEPPGWSDWRWESSGEPEAPPEDWGGGGSGGVREPRRPLPSGGAASVALPEPDDRAA